MPEILHTATPAKTTARQAPIDSRSRATCLVLQALGGLASSYYFNYLFFYLKDHFNYGNRENLLIAGFQGLIYMVSAYLAGEFIHRAGHTAALKIGCAGMGLGMVVGALAPHFLGYGKALQWVEVAIVLGWTMTMCQTWPTLQALLGRGQTRLELSRTACVYNLTWSSMTALAYLTSGALLEHFGGEILFWLPAGLHIIQLLILAVEERRQGGIASIPPQADVSLKATAEETKTEPETHAGGWNFLYLARVASPFAYVAIYGMLPVVPKLAEHLHLSIEAAGFWCSVWQWVRMFSFLVFFFWTGWHYRFRWLLVSFLTMVGSFMTMLVATNLGLLLAAELVFGLSVGLIYYSSLFYSMDLGISGGKGGGIHEAMIGMGMFMGPAAGVLALHYYPHDPSASTWGTGLLLSVGLILFLAVRWRGGRSTQFLEKT